MTWKSERHGWTNFYFSKQSASMDTTLIPQWFRKKYKEHIFARLNDDFDTEKYYDRNCQEPAWQYLLLEKLQFRILGNPKPMPTLNVHGRIAYRYLTSHNLTPHFYFRLFINHKCQLQVHDCRKLAYGIIALSVHRHCRAYRTLPSLSQIGISFKSISQIVFGIHFHSHYTDRRAFSLCQPGNFLLIKLFR